MPNNLIPELLPAENSIHGGLQVMRSRRITMQIDAPGRFEYSAHLNQPNSHETQVRPHAVRAGIPSRFNSLNQLRIIIRQLVNSFLVYVFFPAPSILKLCTLSQ